MNRRIRKTGTAEKIIMACSGVLIMTALTITGTYLHHSEQKTENDGYVVDFSAIEAKRQGEGMPNTEKTTALEMAEADLDYDADYQAMGDSNHFKNQDVKDVTSNSAVNPENPDDAGMFREEKETGQVELKTEELVAAVQPEPSFSEADSLSWPVAGDVLINFSMDKTTYFATLDQYKYNPGIVISAAQGAGIAAPASGRVTKVSYDPQYGNIVVMDLGNGYELTCGQLDQLTVSAGSFVKRGDYIGCVGAPTKYFNLEGSNLFMELTKDGTPISPLPKLQ